MTMPQNDQTGAAGDAFGREVAPLVAQVIGAVMARRNSNEAMLNGQPIVIKCARRRTRSVVVTYLMLDGLEAVIGAFETEDGSFQVFSLPAAIYRERMTPTRSRGASAGRVGIVQKRVFEVEGTPIATVSIPESSG
jgi:hypothetical protein